MDEHLQAVRRAGRAFVQLGALTAVLVLAGCGGASQESGQVVARVNKSEITGQHVDFLLQQQRGVKPEQVDEAGRQVLERLIDQELAVQQADAMKLDRDPRVIQMLEIGRREILARAYAETAAGSSVQATAEEVQAYYDQNPALFSERRVYNLQEIAVEVPADQVAALSEKLAEVKNVAAFLEHLNANGIRFVGNQAVRSAEQLPLAMIKTFAAMKDGQAFIAATPNGAQVVVLVGSREQPVTVDQARPAIEQFLMNERKRKTLDDNRKALRAAASIQYLGKFANAAPASGSASGAGK